METEGFLSMWNHHKCLSWLFSIHLKTSVMGLQPFYIFNTSSAGIDWSDVSDVWSRSPDEVYYIRGIRYQLLTLNSLSASLPLNILARNCQLQMKGKYLLTWKLNLLNFTMGALLKIYTCIFVQFLSNFSCGKTVWMRLKASPALKGLIK